jgi:hypothetical protein
MSAPRQGDLFEHRRPDDVRAESAPAYRPDLVYVRSRLQRILAEARNSMSMPWDADRLLVYRTIFPHMTCWLPEAEGAQLRFEFDAEIARLEAA